MTIYSSAKSCIAWFKLAEIVKTSSTARNAGQTKFYNANTSRSSSNPPPPRNNFR